LIIWEHVPRMRVTGLELGLFIALLACFIVFMIIVFKSPGSVRGKKEKSPGPVRLGAILQSVSYMFAWTFRRPRVNPFGGGAHGPDVVVALLSLSAAVVAIALAAVAKKHLGRQWALAARVVEGHQLVTDGPFGRVRHPIYLAMGILLLAPVIGLSSGPGAVLSLALFAVGTSLRTRAEESLLAETFGAEYAAYRKRVPAFLPRLRKDRGSNS
jgi:protein-S-isoprenylcysteine O-methyltransferase Ste14